MSWVNLYCTDGIGESLYFFIQEKLELLDRTIDVYQFSSTTNFVV